MDKVSYAMGLSIAQQLMKSGVNNLNVQDFSTALLDSFAGADPKIPLNEANDVLQTYFKKINDDMKKKLEEEKKVNKKAGTEYLKENATKTGVVTTKSGLQYKVITEGTGKSPSAHSRVECDYEGCLVNGQKFDSSYDRHQTATFGLDQVIPGWTEGLQLMKEGAKYQFYIPYELGYGEVGMPPAIPGCSTLIFTVELHKVL